MQVPSDHVEGIVVKKQQEVDRLLLTISAPEGAILATFKQKVTEIALLVDEGDTVSMNLRRYEPFVEDPTVVRVRKPDQSFSPSSSDNDVLPEQSERPSDPTNLPARVPFSESP
jgi:hypothetical protein